MSCKVTILKPASVAGIQKANTLRLWDLDSRKIISTITIPNGQGVSNRAIRYTHTFPA